MSIEFGVIFNPSNLILKHEVWVRGDAIYNDALGQPESKQNFVQKARSFATPKAAESFVKYQQQTRAFKTGLPL